jgi:4-hydroxythreonine-4-phosphate dehydrogenase
MTKARKILRIGITMGDANGIGPELIIQAFQEPHLREMCTPIVYGSTRALNAYRKILSVDKFSYNVIEEPSQAQPRKVSVVDCARDLDGVEPGVPSEATGRAAYESLQAAVADLQDGTIDALVTLPIDKATIQNEDFKFPGHTEYLTEAFSGEDSLMFMVHEDLKVGVVTGHVPVKGISDAITTAGIVSKIRLMAESLRKDFNIEKPRIAVLGLNPHAGDNGLLGSEEKEVIEQAIAEVHKDNAFVFGPYPADGFFGAGTFRKFDGVLAMYHDQGLIPFKLLAGFEGVNFTAGLPKVRTSPDHGLAYDLAGTGRADPTSFLHAIYAAIDIARNRKESDEIDDNSLWKNPNDANWKNSKRAKGRSVNRPPAAVDEAPPTNEKPSDKKAVAVKKPTPKTEASNEEE